jgi:alkyl sulfatase BDS1-like metallo-beta-lactamase superfamily hydrolase
MKLPNGKLGVITAVMFFAGAAVAAPPSQYNMSLTAQPVETPIGAITHPYAATADEVADTESKTVKRITDGVYRLGGWGIANTIAVEGPEGWVIVDAGDNLEAAQEQRQRLEAVVGKIKVAGVVYTHSHYVWGAKAWQDEGTEFYGHEDLVSNLNADQGVSVLSGNFMTRAVAQFGMLHPKQGSDAFPNHYGFSAEKLSGTKAFVPPGVTFEDGAVEQHTIGGLTVEVLPHKTDVQDSLAYYFPEKKLLSTNGMNAPVIFNLYTLRGDWYRDPMVFVEAADLVLTRDVEFHVDVHGSAKIGRERVKTGLQETRDQMQLLHDQTYRAIALGNSKSGFSGNMIRAMGGFDVVLAAARDANTKQTIADWQWALYLSSQLMIADPTNAEVKATRAEAARALGQRTSSANARGWYISEALLQEGKMQYAGHTVSQYQQLSHVLGAVTPQKLASSPVRDNVYYLRYMVDTRLAEGKRAAFNVHFKEQGLSYGIALRNGIIAITEQHNDGPTIELTKAGWSELITGEKTFASLHPSLEAFDTTVAR